MVNGNELDAVEIYSKVIEINPRTVPALRGLSWLRSRAKNRQIRNGEKAVQMSEFLMKSLAPIIILISIWSLARLIMSWVIKKKPLGI